MIVGYYAPLPPARTGVADYAQVLLDALRKKGDVVVNAHKADVNLYHLGNNPLHREIYERALTAPGVVILHDALLNHFFLGTLDRDRYIEEYVYNHGEWERNFGATLYDGRAASASSRRYFDRPMLRRIAERSLAVVVHNPAAAERVRIAAPGAEVVEIPHLFTLPHAPQPDTRARIRHDWQLPPNAFVFGIFGYLRETKRVLPILRAFEKLQRDLPHSRLLLAGTFGSEDLARAAAPSLEPPAILRVGRLPDRDWWNVADAVDAGLALRYPSAAETSGIAIRLMGLGKPVFLTDGPEISRIPDDCCFRIGGGVEESFQLSHTMELAVRRPDISAAIGNRAALYVRQHHDTSRLADQFWNLLCAVSASAPSLSLP
jgi:glycosyltransferase involved in cell wall biosynthesis